MSFYGCVYEIVVCKIGDGDLKAGSAGHFSFDGKWSVEQVTDSSTEGEHVSYPLEERIDKSAENSK